MRKVDWFVSGGGPRLAARAVYVGGADDAHLVPRRSGPQYPMSPSAGGGGPGPVLPSPWAGWDSWRHVEVSYRPQGRWGPGCGPLPLGGDWTVPEEVAIPGLQHGPLKMAFSGRAVTLLGQPPLGGAHRGAAGEAAHPRHAGGGHGGPASPGGSWRRCTGLPPGPSWRWTAPRQAWMPSGPEGGPGVPLYRHSLLPHPVRLLLLCLRRCGSGPEAGGALRGGAAGGDRRVGRRGPAAGRACPSAPCMWGAGPPTTLSASQLDRLLGAGGDLPLEGCQNIRWRRGGRTPLPGKSWRCSRKQGSSASPSTPRPCRTPCSGPSAAAAHRPGHPGGLRRRPSGGLPLHQHGLDCRPAPGQRARLPGLSGGGAGPET